MILSQYELTNDITLGKSPTGRTFVPTEDTELTELLTLGTFYIGRRIGQDSLKSMKVQRTEIDGTTVKLGQDSFEPRLEA